MLLIGRERALYKYSTTLLFLVFWLQVFLQEPRLTRHTQALTLALLTYPTIRLPPRGQTDSLADGSLVASSTELSRKPRYLFCWILGRLHVLPHPLTPFYSLLFRGMFPLIL